MFSTGGTFALDEGIGQMQDAVRVLRPGRAMHREIFAGPRPTSAPAELPEAACIREAWYRAE